MVIVIIGVLASMAIPRLSRGAADAGQATLDADLAIVRLALQHYAAEHRGVFPGTTATATVKKLTLYSDSSGNAQAAKDTSHLFGPYLAAVPSAPVGENMGSTGILIDSVNSPPVADASTGDGWIYNPFTGEFYANTGTTPQGPDKKILAVK